MKAEQRNDIGDLLHRLSSADAGAAWVEFLDRYAQVIINTASQFEYEQERINDCFLFVCEKLNDDRFRRLLLFNTKGAAKFQSWLSVVVFNLCVDWHRREFGRARLLPAISALPAFDQSVYRLVIEQGMSKEAGFQTLKIDFPDLERESVANALGRIYSVLTPRQRWQINVQSKRRSTADALRGPVELLPDPGFRPDTEAEVQQEIEILQKAISQLPTDQRLLLRLRYQEGLSLKKIAQLKHLGDSNRAWRHIQAAVSELYKHIRRNSFSKRRKN